jgi:hypothetical protein
MSKLEDEAAQKVFGDTLGPREQIIITDIIGSKDDDGRRQPFVVFLGAEKISIVNMGRGAYEDPLTTNKPVFMHELTHVWQLRHQSLELHLCEVITTQARGEIFDHEIYDYGQPGKDWEDYGTEEQAELVEAWVDGEEVTTGKEVATVDGDGKATDPLYPYIYYNIRRENPSARYIEIISAPRRGVPGGVHPTPSGCPPVCLEPQ